MPGTNRLFSTAPIIKHSFATPLTNILLNTEIAVQTPEKAGVYLQRVLLNARHLESILKSTDSNKHQFLPAEAIQELLTLNAGSQLKKHLIFRLDLEKNFHLSGNKLVFQEMLVCLLNNAFESYKPKKYHKLIFLSATKNKKHLIISITDAGSGMSWLQQRLSTHPLYSNKNSHSGLGLYFVRQTIQKEFKGHLKIISRLKRGTTVILDFPLGSNQIVTKPALSFQYGAKFTQLLTQTANINI